MTLQAMKTSGNALETKFTSSVEITVSELQTIRNLVSTAKMKCRTSPSKSELESELDSLTTKLYKIGLNRIDIKWI